MPFTDWSLPADYEALNKSWADSINQAGCNPCSGNECPCFPPGIVEIKDNNGNVIGGFTANDAEGYYLNVAPPPPGFVRWINAGVFMGFVTPAEYLQLTA